MVSNHNRGTKQRFAHVIIMALVTVFVLAGNVLAAKPIVYDWAEYLSEEFGLTRAQVMVLRNSGMNWESIEAYLESLYPRTPPDLSTADCLSLANDLGISPVEALELMKEAAKLRRRPSWVGRLVKKCGSLEKSASALLRHSEAKWKLSEAATGGGPNPGLAHVERVVFEVYGLSGGLVRRLHQGGIDPKSILEIVFVIDSSVPSEVKDQEIILGEVPSNWRELLPDLSGLRTRWPARRFPEHLLPLRPPGAGTLSSAETRAGVFHTQGTAGFQIRTGTGPRPEETEATPSSEVHAASTGGGSLIDLTSFYNADRTLPYKSYFDRYSEVVDPSTGGLTIKHTDFVLPGRNGLDFELTRIFNSQVANLNAPVVTSDWEGNYYHSTDPALTYREKRYCLGVGWMFGFPTLEFVNTSTANILLHKEDGSTASIKSAITATVKGRYYFYSVAGDLPRDMVFEESTAYPSAEDGINSKYRLTRKDGMRWYFADDGRLLCMQNKFGDRIRFKHETPSGRPARIISAWDTVGRRIDFSYSSSEVTVRVMVEQNSVWTEASKWIYRLEGTAEGKEKLAQVYSPLYPLETTPWGAYTYETVSASFSGDIYSGYGSYHILELTGVRHYLGAESLYQYITRERDLDNNDPSTNNSTMMQYRSISRRLDRVPTLNVTALGRSAETRQNGERRYTYLPWNQSTGRYITECQGYRAAGESGSTPLKESWEYDVKHRLMKYTVQGTGCGTQRNQTEITEERYSYTLFSLLLRKEIIRKLGSRQHTEVVDYEWDSLGNLLSEVSSVGGSAQKGTEYYYDHRYSMPTQALEICDFTTRHGRVTRSTLDHYGKVVASSELFMGNRTTSGTLTISGPTIAEISDHGPEVAWVWSPRIPITSFTVRIKWWDSILCTVRYKAYYRTAQGSSWVQFGSRSSFLLFGGNGVDPYTISPPAGVGRYDIRVVAEDEHIGIELASATGPNYVWQCDPVSAISRWDYAYYTYPPVLLGMQRQSTGRIQTIQDYMVTPSGQATLESQRDYTYDTRWTAYPEQETVVVTKASGYSSTIRTIVEYDDLGRVTRSRTEDETSGPGAATDYAYDGIGRLTRITYPYQHSGSYGERPFRAWRYYSDIRHVRVRDELGKVTFMTCDGLGRRVLTGWEEVLPGSYDEHGFPMMLTENLAKHQRYDSLGHVVREYDAEFNETMNEYDPFGRLTKVTYPGPGGHYREAWYETIANTQAPPVPLSAPYQGSLPWIGWQKTRDEDGNFSYAGSDMRGRLVWTASNQKQGQPEWDMVWRRYDSLDRPTNVYMGRQAGLWDQTIYAYTRPSASPTSVDMPGNTEGLYEYSYNARGHRVSEKYGIGVRYEIMSEYDALGRAIRTVYPGNA